ncbi:MAG TPA: RagB/SusD family nutrient uptake outer membrane protein, partial [Algoriphagus sp.]|nr:RagB/SusD family nutrient uptake outer membrane protein [Algoriphagus sp.]
MKKLLSKIFLLGAILSFGCAEDHLDTLPTDAVSENAVFTTTQNAMTA